MIISNTLVPVGKFQHTGNMTWNEIATIGNQAENPVFKDHRGLRSMERDDSHDEAGEESSRNEL